MDLKQHILKMKNYNAGLKDYFVQHEEEEEEYESHNTDGEVDDEEIVTNEILSVANSIEEEVAVAAVVDDGKVACDICGKRSIHKKNNK